MFKFLCLVLIPLAGAAYGAEAIRTQSSPWAPSSSFLSLPSASQLSFNDPGGPVLVITAAGVVQHPSGKPIAQMPRDEQIKLLCAAIGTVALAYKITLTRCVD